MKKGGSMTRLIHVGNSLGIRIPKALITKLRFQEDTELEFTVTAKGLLISPIHAPREGWKEAFTNAQEEPLLLGDILTNEFDKSEWVW
jgi:antitoxin component of MazEF toxin-antitoxin module